MAVNVAPASLTDEQKIALRAWTRTGGTLLSGAIDVEIPCRRKRTRSRLRDEDVKILDEIWKEMNSDDRTSQLGSAAVQCVEHACRTSSESADKKQTVLQLVNYSGFPVENVTVHLLE